jgi:hypothetical protein
MKTCRNSLSVLAVLLAIAGAELARLKLPDLDTFESQEA